MFRKLYNWTLHWAGSRYAEPGLLSEKERNLLCFYRYLARSLAGRSLARVAETAR